MILLLPNNGTFVSISRRDNKVDQETIPMACLRPDSAYLLRQKLDLCNWISCSKIWKNVKGWKQALTPLVNVMPTSWSASVKKSRRWASRKISRYEMSRWARRIEFDWISEADLTTRCVETNFGIKISTTSWNFPRPTRRTSCFEFKKKICFTTLNEFKTASNWNNVRFAFLLFLLSSRRRK